MLPNEISPTELLQIDSNVMKTEFSDFLTNFYNEIILPQKAYG